MPKSTNSPADRLDGQRLDDVQQDVGDHGRRVELPWTIRSLSQSSEPAEEGSRPGGAPGFQTGGTVTTTTPLWARFCVPSETTGAVWNEPELPSYASQTRVGEGTDGRGVNPPDETGAGVPAGVTTSIPIEI